ncbi:MAG: 4-hydroxy-tetrahydrodipicolinate synthase [Candidatus Bathyarchaeota archaeon]|nr:4-hydroxy-tetrahydrodipicolinate synthase [Candidatus Bathyarchaeota archaeon]
MKKFEGTYVVAVTPFNNKGELDVEALKDNIDFYIENGVHGLVVTGSTGEFAALSDEETKKIHETSVERVNGRVPLIAGTAACSTKKVIETTRYAQDVGVDGALVVPPFYSKIDDEEIFNHYESIGTSVDLPIMLYNNPFTSKIDIKPELISKISEVDNIKYVKESSGDITRIWKILDLTKGKMTVFCGADNLALESFFVGAKGWICVAANIFPRETSLLYELANFKKDYVRALKHYQALLPLYNYLEDTGKFTHIAKYGLELRGMKAGLPREPFLPLSDQQKEKAREIIQNIQKLS